MIRKLWEKICKWWNPVITYEWCVVGCQIGRHSWLKEKRKCINGEPEGVGWLLTIVKCGNEKDADDVLREFNDIAEKYNAVKYGK